MEGAHQACVAGRAGASGLDGAGEGGHGAGGGGVVRRRGGLVEAHHISLLQPGGAGPPGLGHLDIGRLLQGQAHKAAAVGVQLHGVPTQQHPARGDGVAPLLKIQIPAEAVHDGQIYAALAVFLLTIVVPVVYLFCKEQLIELKREYDKTRKQAGVI